TDGGHIRTLILTLFYRYLREVIEAGYIYIAQPPLYKIKKGKEIFYAYNDTEKDVILKDLGAGAVEEINPDDGEPEEEEEEKATKKRTPKVTVQRYKGLGDMNSEELWETTMDPERRVMKQITIEDLESTNSIFDILMGTE